MSQPVAAARTGPDRFANSQKAPARPDPGPILAVVSVAKQRIWVYGSTGLIAQSAVSTGMAGYPTPTGVFSVIQKNRFHRSNIYSSAPMPYMQRITWSGVALHAGVVPGYPASHGCIRLPNQFAVELWGLTRIGARVVVAREEASVSDVEHAHLPVPLLRLDQEEQREKPGGADAEASEGPDAEVVGIALKEGAGDAASPGPRLLNPQERAKVIKARAIADARVKAKAGKAAVAMSALRAREADRAIAAVRVADLAVLTARARRDTAAKAMDRATTLEVIERARDLLITAEARLADAEKAADEARSLETVKTPEAIAAAKKAWEAEKASDEAATALKVAERGVQPISILVSRKAGRVYIRQAWAPVHEAPVAFKDPWIPIGTHAYVAMSPAADGKTVRWLSVSLPPSVPRSAGLGHRTGRGGAQPPSLSEAAAPTAHAHETAASVLARFDFPEDTRRFIEERLWTGASLVVSDEGISNETGKTTDFIVLTR